MASVMCGVCDACGGSPANPYLLASLQTMLDIQVPGWVVPVCEVCKRYLEVWQRFYSNARQKLTAKYQAICQAKDNADIEVMLISAAPTNSKKRKKELKVEDEVEVLWQQTTPLPSSCGPAWPSNPVQVKTQVPANCDDDNEPDIKDWVDEESFADQPCKVESEEFIPFDDPRLCNMHPLHISVLPYFPPSPTAPNGSVFSPTPPSTPTKDNGEEQPLSNLDPASVPDQLYLSFSPEPLLSIKARAGLFWESADPSLTSLQPLWPPSFTNLENLPRKKIKPRLSAGRGNMKKTMRETLQERCKQILDLDLEVVVLSYLRDSRGFMGTEACKEVLHVLEMTNSDKYRRVLCQEAIVLRYALPFILSM